MNFAILLLCFKLLFQQLLTTNYPFLIVITGILLCYNINITFGFLKAIKYHT